MKFGIEAHEAKSIGHLYMHSQRVSDALMGRPYRDVRFGDPDARRLGYTSIREVNSLDAVLRSIYDRVSNRAQAFSKRKLEIANPDQVALAISDTANKYLQGVSRVFQTNDIREAYTRASAVVLEYLAQNGDLEKVEEDGPFERIAMFGKDSRREKEDDDDKDEDDYKEPTDNDDDTLTVFLIDEEDLDAYVRSDRAMFDEMSRMIDETPSIAIRVSNRMEIDPEGEERLIAPLDINQVNRVTMGGLAYYAIDPSLFALRVGDLKMRIPAKNYDNITLEFILLDASISMGVDERYIRAYAYAHNRLLKAKEGLAIVVVIMFAGSPHVMSIQPKGKMDIDREVDEDNWGNRPVANSDSYPWLIDTPEKADAAMEQFFVQYSMHSGGSTHIPKAIDAGYQYIDLVREIVGDRIMGDNTYLTIITDDDQSSAYIKTRPDVHINCLAVADNPGMRRACAETNGTFTLLHAIHLPR